MRLLLDANLSPRLAELLSSAGWRATHLREYGLQRASDEEILLFARERAFVVVSEDTDYGELLAKHRSETPSFVLLRSGEPLTPERQARLLVANLESVAEDLTAGAIVVIEPARLRVRALPVLPRRET